MTDQTLYRRNFLLHLQERTEYHEPVLLKEPAHEQLSGAQIGRLHNEYAISRQLDDVSGVRPVYTLEGSQSDPVLLLKYIKGNNLAEISQMLALDLQQKLQLAVEISSILGRIHDAGVMHRDISSGNIMVAEDVAPAEVGWVTIIDFGLATTLRQDELAQPVATDAVAGTLAYISPEQTGRMNRAVDYRSDLYSLGVVLYELFAEQLPFQTGDTMEMIHAHIAVQPVPPHQRNAEIPETVSQIILRLLAKNAEDRYQSTLGLRADLERCLDQLQRSGTVESFQLGQDDFSGRLQIPQKLYGRQAEIKQLVDTYERAAKGNPEIIFIAGYSGVGKTALVHEIRREILMRQGRFIEGKFDQLQRTVPYSAWAQAFAQLANNWLAESEDKLARWREIILEAVGDNGQVLIDVIPALERITGPQPEVPQLGGLENQNRFNYTFNRLISSLATPETPLVVFLDDLQWIDPASLSLIESLMAVQSGSSLLVVGAYRDNEVGADHPLVASQERMSGDGDRVRIITLADLKSVDIDHLLADSLQLAVADCRDLSQALREKTAGNPFYFRQQLYALEADELLFFDRDQGRWVWKAELQQSLEAGGNVVDLMIRKIQTLPVETQETLSIAACLGNRFDVSSLDTITGRSQMTILSELNPALQGGLLIRSNGYFSFTHDRIQEAAYLLIPKSDLARTHLGIGRLLQADIADESFEEHIFAIVGHLNTGRALIDSDSERIELAKLNLLAGQKAKAASAFSDAKQYIEIGLDQLGQDGGWREQYVLTLQLHNENAELAAFTGQYDQVAPTAELIHANARDVLDQVHVYMTQIEAATTQYDFGAAIEIGLDILGKLGFDIPLQPGSEDYKYLKDKYFDLLTDRPADVIAALPEMTDERALAASNILASELTATYISRQDIYPIVGLLGANLTLEFGHNVWSPVFFAANGNIFWLAEDLGTPSEDVLTYLLFVRQMFESSLVMQQNSIYRRSQTRTLGQVCVTGAYCMEIEVLSELAQTMFLSGFETGDLNYGAQGALHRSIYGLAAGKNLNQYRNQISEQFRLLHQLNQPVMANYLSIFLQGAIAFQEPPVEPHRLIGSFFDEDAFLPAAEAANDFTGRHFYYAIKLMLGYHFDLDSELLIEYMREAEQFMIGGPGLLSFATTTIYAALGWLSLYPDLAPEDQKDALNQVDRSLELMEIWSQSAPGTFRHLYDLITAEYARVLGDTDGAISHYERAIEGAREVSFTNDEAMANELYARFWHKRENERFASLFMREAHSLYRKWGALAKAEHLEQRYPNWLVSKRITIDSSQTGISTSQAPDDLDILTVLKTSQAIASEIELDRLLTFLMSSAIENSGAQSGYLLLPEAGRWIIAAQADLESSGPGVELPLTITENRPLSQGIVNYVARTQETVLLEDALGQGDFTGDPHIQRHEVKSLLCTPLVNQGKTSAILYLGNNLSPGVFTSDRVALLNLLSAQMAISVDNARLLKERSEALRSAETQIRLLFENSPIGIALSTDRGEILTYNKALLDMLRISEAELLREGAASFYTDSADREKLLAAVQESGSVQQFGVPLVRHDGSSFFGSINMSRLLLEGNEVLLVMAEDVTDEITAEQKAATIEERERLARDLHDAVTQTLFSASVLAQASPRMLKKTPDVAEHNFERLAVLIDGALAEMRALLLELRPGRFGEQNLAQLIELLVNSLQANIKAEITFNVSGDADTPEDVTVAFYRIAQESLNNIVRHAAVDEVIVDLAVENEGVRLSIEDDGRGFDQDKIPAGHFGVSNMRERAQQIGAELQIESSLGEGTQVKALWKAQKKDD